MAGSLADMFALPKTAPLPSPNPYGIDLTRPRLENADGSFSTELSATEQFQLPNGQAVWLNFPTVHQGKRLTLDEAIQAVQQGVIQPTGEFRSLDEALTAAQQRSNEIGRLRVNGR